MQIVLVAHDLSENSLGRAYVLWLLGCALDYDVRVTGPMSASLWRPVQGTLFAEACVPAGRPGHVNLATVEDLAAGADAIVSIKAWGDSFGTARHVGRTLDAPVGVDLDEDDAAALVGADANVTDRTLQWANLTLRSRRPWSLKGLTTHRIQEHLRTVGNPILLDRFGGCLVPHARRDPGAGVPHTRESGIVVAWVGTVRRHKGIGDIRAAVQANPAFRIIITAQHPAAVNDREEWLGEVPLDVGRSIVGEADVVAVILRPSGYSRTQLPVKLIDAMLAGRAIIASDTQPVRWALGDTGIVVDTEPGSLSRALQSLENPEVRAQLGSAARRRALELFEVESVAPRFRDAMIQLGSA